MSDNAIKVGDLVCVVRDGNCVCSPHPSPLLGQIFAVTAIGVSFGNCTQCGRQVDSGGLGAQGYHHYENGWLRLERLRRIPPLAELDEAERKQREPA